MYYIKAMSGKYDKIFKECFGAVLFVLIGEVLEIKAVKVSALNTKLQITEERDADFLLDITLQDGSSFILHIEFQAANDSDMPYRMLRYWLFITQKYGKPVRQVLFYVGKEPLRMPNYIKNEKVSYEYDIIDFRNIDYEKFMNSDSPQEIVIAILCNFKAKDDTIVIKNLLNRIKETVKGNLSRCRYIRQLEVLSQLRDLQEKVYEEADEMALVDVYDIERDVRYKQGMEKGMEKGIERGVERGLIKGLREGIQLAIELKFSINGMFLIDIIDHIENLERLEQIKGYIKKASSVDELTNMLEL